MLLRMSLILISTILFRLISSAQDTTKVHVWLKLENENSIKVRIYPPNENSDWTYIVPRIIPGTYLKVNYQRLYHSIEAIDIEDKKIEIRQTENKYKISGNPLKYLEYTVSQSFGNKMIWDNAFGCAGTIFSEKAFLINFQLINGYFEGFQNNPFLVSFEKKENLYGASSMKCIKTTSTQDFFYSPNYSSLIDQPILFAEPDTSSFVIGDHRFKVAIHSENGFKSASDLVPGLEKTMKNVKMITNFTSKEDYYFLFYFVGLQKFKTQESRFGIGSALEHKHSSVYYYSDNSFYDPDFNDLQGIVAHEYLHTILPLNLHSEKIRYFNFSDPDMSKHIWLYEGFTDYLAVLANSKNDTLLIEYLTAAITSSEKNAEQSMTESSLAIAENNKGNFEQKINELGNFYQKGKLIAFALDIELLNRTNGSKRLIDVLTEMSDSFSVQPFKDDSLYSELARYTFPEFIDFYEKYISGTALIPLEKYFHQLGWQLQGTGQKAKTFCNSMNAPYNFDLKSYNVQQIRKNSLGLKVGDQILKINGVVADLSYAHKTGMFLDFNSHRFNYSSLEVEVLRNKETLVLVGDQSIEYKLRSPRIILNNNFTLEQQDFRSMYFEK